MQLLPVSLPPADTCKRGKPRLRYVARRWRWIACRLPTMKCSDIERPIFRKNNAHELQCGVRIVDTMSLSPSKVVDVRVLNLGPDPHAIIVPFQTIWTEVIGGGYLEEESAGFIHVLSGLNVQQPKLVYSE